MTIGTYKITNTKNGRIYFGSSNEIEKRKIRHFTHLKGGVHGNIYLQRSYEKYGQQVFKFEIIDTFETIEESRLAEQMLIDAHWGLECYNMSKHASGGDLISYHPNRDMIVAKMKDSLIKRYAKMSTEERKIMFERMVGESNPMFGRNHTEESKKLISEALTGKYTGENSHRFGVIATEVTKEKMSLFASTRTGEKNAFYGKTHTDETKSVLRDKSLGKVPTNARKVNINGDIYTSLAEAAKVLDVAVGTILHRIKSPNELYAGYSYVNENETKHTTPV